MILVACLFFVSKNMEYLWNENRCSTSSLNEIKIIVLHMTKYLKNDASLADEEFLMRAEFFSIFPELEKNLRASFLKIIDDMCVVKQSKDALSSFLEECEDLLTIIFELLSSQKIAYVVIPCICSIASLTYYFRDTYLVSQHILIECFSRFSQLRSFILDDLYKVMILLLPRNVNLSLNYVENIGKSIFLLLQSIPANSVNVNNELTNFEKTREQIRSVAMHWISLFVKDIELNASNEHLPKIFNHIIRYIVRMLHCFLFPSAPFVLNIILRSLMTCLASKKTTVRLKKLALEQICFIVVNLKKIVNTSSTERNIQFVKKIYENVQSRLKTTEKRCEVNMCIEILLILYMEKQFNEEHSFLSPTNFFRLNLLNQAADYGHLSIDSVKKRKMSKPSGQNSNPLAHYYDMLKTITFQLNKDEEANIIYQFLMFSKSELPLLVDHYFEKIILITATKNNAVRLSAVKHLVPLIEVNDKWLKSEILRIAIRSLILDHSFFVRENILVALTKIVLLHAPCLYAAIFNENCEKILMRLLDVNVSVRKAALNLLEKFCTKNRDDEKVFKIMTYSLHRMRDRDESVKFQTAEMFRRLWFSNVAATLQFENSVKEIMYLANENLNYLIYLFDYILLTNQVNSLITPLDLYKRIVEFIAHNEPNLNRSNLGNINILLKRIFSHLTKNNSNLSSECIKRFVI